MFASFLPSNVTQLTEETSIALVQAIQRIEVQTPLALSPIATSYLQVGQGSRPMLLLHGFDSSVLEFRRLVPCLADQYTLWAVDFLGFGFTDRGLDLDYSPEAIKTHLYYTWKTVIGHPIVMVGASMGGAVAIDFALTYPEAVHQLVLINSAGFAQGPDIGKLMVPPIGNVLGYLATEFLRQPGVRRRVSLQAYHDPKLVTADAELCAALHLQLPNWNRALSAFTKSGGYNFLADKIPQIQVPTLVIWGEHDRILGTADAQKFQQAIPHSQLHWIAQCGHVPHLEKPQETASAIRQFVA